jgi:hypothetical protein
MAGMRPGWQPVFKAGTVSGLIYLIALQVRAGMVYAPLVFVSPRLAQAFGHRNQLQWHCFSGYCQAGNASYVPCQPL